MTGAGGGGKRVEVGPVLSSLSACGCAVVVAILGAVVGGAGVVVAARCD